MTAQCIPMRNPGALNVVERVSARSNTCPEAIAICDVDHMLTFGELEARANRLAHFLRSQGVQTGDVVALLLDRSVCFAVAALAAMKAGAAYLPMDPEYPRNRIEYFLRDSGAAIVLTDSENRGLVPACIPSSVVDFDFTEFLSYPDGAPGVRLEGEDLAYIIYTSGSTGQPKGVELTHAGLSNLVAWHIRTFSVQPSDRASQVASVGFDAAVWELWPSLCAGASVLIPEGLTKMVPERLRDWILREKITLSFAPTCIGELLMTLSWPAETALRYLLTGADVLRRYPPAGLPFRVVNNYGPTECTVVTTSGYVPDTLESKELPSIGKAIDHVQVYILNEALQPVLAGEDGEICIGGAGLARGYRNNPELTSERFTIYHSHNGPVRVYRTGDIGRVSGRGEIEFRGRADDQVKIRGHRIELQEIALVLNRHPSVRASAVLAVQNSCGEQELAAYVVTHGDATESDWSSHLAASLPRYMIPSVFVRVPQLPLTANGKLDRSALPIPLIANPAGYVAPRSLMEERMEKLVAQLLGLESVSVRDNFFHLGGHSLFGAQLISRIRNKFGVELSLRGIFEHPTVELLSHQVEVALVARLRVTTDLGASMEIVGNERGKHGYV
jgi:amino acid adenylation domain-containing protein